MSIYQVLYIYAMFFFLEWMYLYMRVIVYISNLFLCCVCVLLLFFSFFTVYNKHNNKNNIYYILFFNDYVKYKLCHCQYHSHCQYHCHCHCQYHCHCLSHCHCHCHCIPFPRLVYRHGTTRLMYSWSMTSQDRSAFNSKYLDTAEYGSTRVHKYKIIEIPRRSTFIWQYLLQGCSVNENENCQHDAECSKIFNFWYKDSGISQLL